MIQITPKGVLVGAIMLYEQGFLRKKTVDRIEWFVSSGIGWENPQFKKLWRKVNIAARRATGKEIFRHLAKGGRP